MLRIRGVFFIDQGPDPEPGLFMTKTMNTDTVVANNTEQKMSKLFVFINRLS